MREDGGAAAAVPGAHSRAHPRRGPTRDRRLPQVAARRRRVRPPRRIRDVTSVAGSEIAGDPRPPGSANARREHHSAAVAYTVLVVGPDIFLVIDDYDLAAGATGNPLTPLADFLPHAKDLGLHVVVARRSGGAARAMFDPVLARMRELGCMGLMMSASPDEGVLLGSVRPSPLPPGRATLITRGQCGSADTGGLDRPAVTEVVIEVGPATIRGPNDVRPEWVSTALDCIDDEIALIDDRPVSVQDVWDDVMSAVVGHGVDTAVVICPAWWSSARIDRVRKAAHIGGDRSGCAGANRAAPRRGLGCDDHRRDRRRFRRRVRPGSGRGRRPAAGRISRRRGGGDAGHRCTGGGVGGCSGHCARRRVSRVEDCRSPAGDRRPSQDRRRRLGDACGRDETIDVSCSVPSVAVRGLRGFPSIARLWLRCPASCWWWCCAVASPPRMTAVLILLPATCR